MVMKKFLLIVCSLLIICLTNLNIQPIKVNANSNIDINTINHSTELEIFGQGTVLSKPDSAVINARIEYADTIENVSKNNTWIIFNNIKNILFTNNINDENIKRNYFYSYKNNSNTQSMDYITYIDFSININNLNILINILPLLTKQQYLEIISINYELKNSKSAYTKALKLAINNATEKATDLFNTSNIKICKIIEQNNYYPIAVYREYISDNIEDDINTPLEIIANVIVEFTIN